MSRDEIVEVLRLELPRMVPGLSAAYLFGSFGRGLADPSRIDVDVREERSVEHTLQMAVQAALDVASHVVSDERWGEPRTNQELFDFFARHGWIGEDLARSLRAAAGFRNVLVHGYASVDKAIVRDFLENHLQDLVAFVAAVRARLVSG